MKCKRCGKEKYIPADNNICGTCADDLRERILEEDAEILMVQASDEELARQKYEDEEQQDDSTVKEADSRVWHP